MEAKLDLSAYPPTLKSTRAVVQASAGRIDALWRAARKQHGTDDLVVIIDGKMNSIRVAPRATIYDQLRRHDEKNSFLKNLCREAPAANGSIVLWCITAFNEGRTFITLATVARS